MSLFTATSEGGADAYGGRCDRCSAQVQWNIAMVLILHDGREVGLMSKSNIGKHAKVRGSKPDTCIIQQF